VGLETSTVVLVVLALAGQINSATTLDLFLPTSGDRPWGYGATVERRDGQSWLRDDDDDDDDDQSKAIIDYNRLIETVSK